MPRKKKKVKTSSRSSRRLGGNNQGGVRKPNNKSLAQHRKNQLVARLPRHLHSRLKHGGSKEAVSLGDDQSTHTAMVWRDSQGPVMYLRLRDNDPQRLRAELAADIDKISKNRKPPLFLKGEAFPHSLIVEVGNANARETEAIVRAAFAKSPQSAISALHQVKNTAAGGNGATLEFVLTRGFSALAKALEKESKQRKTNAHYLAIQNMLAEASAIEQQQPSNPWDKKAQIIRQRELISNIRQELKKSSSTSVNPISKRARNQAILALDRSLQNKDAVLQQEAALIDRPNLDSVDMDIESREDNVYDSVDKLLETGNEYDAWDQLLTTGNEYDAWDQILTAGNEYDSVGRVIEEVDGYDSFKDSNYDSVDMSLVSEAESESVTSQSEDDNRPDIPPDPGNISFGSRPPPEDLKPPSEDVMRLYRERYQADSRQALSSDTSAIPETAVVGSTAPLGEVEFGVLSDPNPTLYFRVDAQNNYHFRVDSNRPPASGGWQKVEQFCSILATHWLKNTPGEKLAFSDLSESDRASAVDQLRKMGGSSGRLGQQQYAKSQLSNATTVNRTAMDTVLNGQGHPPGTNIWFANDAHVEAARVLSDGRYEVYDPNFGDINTMTRSEFQEYLNGKNRNRNVYDTFEVSQVQNTTTVSGQTQTAETSIDAGLPAVDDSQSSGEYGPAPPRLVDSRLMSVEAFKKATSSNRILGRTPEYHATLAALQAYHKELADAQKRAHFSIARLDNASKKKNELLRERFTIERRKKSEEAGLSTVRQLQTKYSLELATLKKEGKDKKAIEDMQKKLEDIDKAIRNSVDTLKQLEGEIQQKNEDIREQDQGAIQAALDANQKTFQDSHERVSKSAEKLKKAVEAYRLKKADSGKQGKKDTLEVLATQVDSRAQDTQRVKEAYAQANGVPYDNLLAQPMVALPSDTASEVYKVTLNATIGDTGKREGFAKKAPDSPNDTTANLGFGYPGMPMTAAPNLIARQVVSSRIAQFLDSRVVAPEVFSRANDGSVLGVTGIARGFPMMERTPDSDVYRHFDLSDPRIQQGLAELQLMDAITGQMDRHMGNVFIDPETGQVTGIDNDMAFPKDTVYDDKVNNALKEQFHYDSDGQLVYTQSLIPQQMAEKIIAMDREQLRQVLQGGPADPEHIDNAAIENALKRFDAVQRRCLALKQQGLLVPPNGWNDGTFHAALQDGFTRLDNSDPSTDHSNYLLRAAYKYDEAGRKENSSTQLPAGYKG